MATTWRSTSLATAALLASLAACGDGTEQGPPAPKQAVWREVAASILTTCTVDGAGTVYCAGDALPGASRQLTPLLTGERFSNPIVSASVCARNATGLIRCRTLAGRAYPLADDGIAFRQIDGDPGAGCGLQADGATFCWFFGTGAVLDAAGLGHPKRVTGVPPLATIGAGTDLACGATAAGDTYCWSVSAYMRDGTLPRRLSTDARLVSLSAGPGHACGLTAAGEAYCWGRTWGPELGLPRAEAGPGCASIVEPYSGVGCAMPQRVKTALRFREIRAGRSRTCALALDGRAYCWGANTKRSLGVDSVPGTETCNAFGHVPCTEVPMAVSGGRTFTALGPAQGFHQCATTAEGGAYCWGDVSSTGEPGGGATGGSATPVPLPEPGPGGA